jgi:sugar-specific transcriptional regulator TrmB
MDDVSNRDQAVELLQQLGLKEYEAKSFVALARRQRGTAKDISETSDVPRTRVYDAVRVLESKGLVEVQHTKPQVFRAVTIEEAVNTFQSEYIGRIESLRSALNGLEPTTASASTDETHEVWSLSGTNGITNRTRQLIEEATAEAVLVIGYEEVFTDDLIEPLRSAQQRGVTVIVGTPDAELKARVENVLLDTEVFVSGLRWLRGSPLQDDDTEISRLLLVDRESILLSSVTGTAPDGLENERGIFGRGFDNGLVAITRRLITTGLLSGDDPVIGDDS